MYRGRKKRREGMGVMPGGVPEMQQGMPQPAQHAQFAQDPSLMDIAKPMVASKAVDAGIEAGMPMAKDAMAAMKAPLMNSTTATTAMKSGVDAGIANAMAGAAPTASGMATQGAGMLGNAAANLGGAAAGQAATGAATAGAASGAAGATGAAAMAGLGAAMPWIGAGLLGAKMFGLFSEGGLVGPLAGLKYKSNGVDSSDEFNVSFQQDKPQ